MKHAVYVELPALPTWPSVSPPLAVAPTATAAAAALERPLGPGEDIIPSKHPWLSAGLPVLNLARTNDFAVHNGTVPFRIDEIDRARGALTILRQLMQTTEIPATFSTVGDVDQSALLKMLLSLPASASGGEDLYEALLALWARPECAGISHTKLARRRFLQLWITRADFMFGLTEHYKAIVRLG